MRVLNCMLLQPGYYVVTRRFGRNTLHQVVAQPTHTPLGWAARMNDVSFDRDPLADYMIAKLVRKSPGKLVFMELYDLPLRFDLLFGRPLFLCFTTRNEAVRMMEEELPEFGVFDLVATAITRVLPGRLASYTLMAALWIRDTLNPFARFYR